MLRLEERVKALEWMLMSAQHAAPAPAPEPESPVAIVNRGRPREEESSARTQIPRAAPEFMAPIVDRRSAMEPVQETLAGPAELPNPELGRDSSSEVLETPGAHRVLEALTARRARRDAPAATSRPAPIDRPPLDLERMIGMRWFAAVGALIVVIGVGLFLKLAYDQGWMKLLPPTLKCGLGAAFGAALVVAGEVIRKRINALASVGISAAGLGALYASAYSAYGVYELLPAAVAFVLLALVSGLGFLVAARAQTKALAVLSIVAAYLSPFVIGESGTPYVFPAYLLALLGLGLTLSAWRAGPFRPLRPLVWWGTVLLGTLWILGEGLELPGLALLFVALFWAAVHAELSLAARAAGPEQDDESPLELRWSDVRFVGTSFSTTIWSAVMAVMVLRWGTAVDDWMAPAAGAVATIAMAVVMSGHLRVLRDVPRTDAQRLGAGLAMQGGALLIATMALGLSGWYETLAWLGVGLGAVGAGRWIRSRGLDVYGIVLLAVAAARLVVVDSPLFWPALWREEVGGIILTHWTLLMAAGAAAWGIAGALLLRFAPEPGRFGAGWWRAKGTALVVGAIAMVHGMFLHPDAYIGSVALVWIVLALCVLGVFRGRAWAPGLACSGVALIGATMMIVLGGRGGATLGEPSPVYGAVGGLVITRWMLLMLAAGSGWIGFAMMLPREPAILGAHERENRVSAVAGPVGLALVLLYASMLHTGAEASSISIAWLALSALLLAIHPRLRRLGIDLFGLAGLAAAIAAWCVAYPFDWMIPRPPLLHPGLGLGLLLAGACAGAAWWLRPAGGRATLGELVPVAAGAAVVLVFASSSLEVARVAGILADDTTVRKAAVSIWWGLFGVGLIAAGFAVRIPIVRHVGLTLLAIGTAKAAVVDLVDVPQIWRVASFIGLGLLMLGVAVVYARATARLKPGSVPT